MGGKLKFQISSRLREVSQPSAKHVQHNLAFFLSSFVGFETSRIRRSYSWIVMEASFFAINSVNTIRHVWSSFLQNNQSDRWTNQLNVKQFSEIYFCPMAPNIVEPNFPEWKTYDVELLPNIEMAPIIFEISGNSEKKVLIFSNFISSSNDNSVITNSHAFVWLQKRLSDGYLPGTGAHDLEHILPPSGKNCPVRGGFRFLWSARRPDPVFNCCQWRELRFFLETIP